MRSESEMIKFRRARWVSLIAAAVWLAVTFVRAFALVTVSAFTAQAQTTQITLSWKTVSEINNAGFNLYRSTSPTGPWISKINLNGLIPSKCPGCIASNLSYSFNDTTAVPGQKYFYKLESVEFGGATQQFGPVSAQIAASTPTPTTTLTPTSPAATVMRTSSPQPSATATITIIPSTFTPTVYSSPTPHGTPTPTATPFPTFIASVVGAPSFTPLPANVKSALPNPSSSNAYRGNANSTPANPPSKVSVNPSLSNSQDDASNPREDAPPAGALPNPVPLVLFGVAGLLAFSSLAVGAVVFYFYARRLIG